MVFLVVAKYQGERRRQQLFILEIISNGDMSVRDLSHRAAHSYSEFKNWAEFFLKKQLPMQTKSWFNKSQAFIRSKSDTYLEMIRDSRLLKKSDGISEFFQNTSTTEKGSEDGDERLDS